MAIFPRIPEEPDVLRYIEKSTLHFVGHEVLNITVNCAPPTSWRKSVTPSSSVFSSSSSLKCVLSCPSLLCEPFPYSHP